MPLFLFLVISLQLLIAVELPFKKGDEAHFTFSRCAAWESGSSEIQTEFDLELLKPSDIDGDFVDVALTLTNLKLNTENHPSFKEGSQERLRALLGARLEFRIHSATNVEERSNRLSEETEVQALSDLLEELLVIIFDHQNTTLEALEYYPLCLEDEKEGIRQSSHYFKRTLTDSNFEGAWDLTLSSDAWEVAIEEEATWNLESPLIQKRVRRASITSSDEKASYTDLLQSL